MKLVLPITLTILKPEQIAKSERGDRFRSLLNKIRISEEQDWLIDQLLFNVQREVFQLRSGR